MARFGPGISRAFFWMCGSTCAATPSWTG